MEGNKQLTIWAKATGPNGEEFLLETLVDTGAEANLVRRGLLSEMMTTSLRQLTLVTADGTRMEGGTKEVTLHLCFATSTPNKKGLREWCTTRTFHEADIQVDANLKYPSLEKARL